MFLFGYGVGTLVTAFIFIMWGHKNPMLIGKVRNKINDTIEDTFDGD